ncbi:MAG: DUF1566 domain-containing protein [bacterium]|nr:DUF1566 domain-containing protein [bacterium]
MTYPIVDTGQDVCYDNNQIINPPGPGERFYGQDAQYDGNQPSYQDNGDGTVTDLVTGLTWEQVPPTSHFTWNDAAAYAEGLILGGHDDWRLPTIKELYSLTNFNGDIHTYTPYINTQYFTFYYPDTSQGYREIDAQYWTSSHYTGLTMNNDSSVFGYNFADGRIKSYPVNTNGGPAGTCYVRCVRGPQTYGVNDFADNGDGTVTDRATGLTWMKDDSVTTMNWEDALAYAESLEYAGYTDWRLPNTKELQSIVDYTHSPNAVDAANRGPAIDSIFNLTETESWFWTSTTHNDNGFGVYVCFGRALAYDSRTGQFTIDAHGAGAQRSDPKAGDPSRYPTGLGPQADQIRVYNYVRCVRGGLGLSSVPDWTLY